MAQQCVGEVCFFGKIFFRFSLFIGLPFVPLVMKKKQMWRLLLASSVWWVGQRAEAQPPNGFKTPAVAFPTAQALQLTDAKWKKPSASATKKELPTSPFLPNYSIEQLPFFCKIEAKMSKKYTLPLKIRLGEVQEEEKMEGKK